MALPTKDELFAQVEVEFRQAHPDAPEHLDPNESDQAHLVEDWGRIRTEIGNRWADEAFFSYYPIGRALDPNDPADADYVAYWLDMRDQIQGEVGQYDWSSPPPAVVQPTWDDYDVNADPRAQPDTQVDPVGGSTGDVNLFDEQVAEDIFDFKWQTLDNWKSALDSFNEVMEAETHDAEEADFAGKLLDAFGEKVLGKFTELTKADLVIDVLKTVVDEANRAKEATTSRRFRDFYVDHVTTVATLKTTLVNQKRAFANSASTTLARLLETDEAQYMEVKDALLLKYLDAQSLMNYSTQEIMFASLTSEWVRQSTYSYGDSYIHIRIEESDLSIIDVTIKAPNGDKLVDRMSRQGGGMDVWNMAAPKTVMFGGGYQVDLDEQNRDVTIAAAQNAKSREMYARMVAAGGLRPWKQ